MTVLLLLALLVTSPAEEGRYVQVLDPSVLGQSVAGEPKVLKPRRPGETEPATVHLDIACGRYYAALVGYWPFVTFEDVRRSLNRDLQAYEKLVFPGSQASWVVSDGEPAFNVLLSEHDDSGAWEALYISEAPPPIQAFMMSVVPAEERQWMRDFNPALPPAMEANTQEFENALEGYCAELALKAKE